MPEPPPIGSPPPADPGPPSHARLDGILEGRVGDAAAVRAAAARANASGFGRVDLSFDGGRFSLLPDAEPIDAERMTDARRQEFLAGLAAAAAASGAPVESTLRCTEVFRDAVRETLFLGTPEGLRALTRERPATDADRAAGAVEDDEPARRLGTGRAVLLGVLFIVAATLIAWLSGWIDRFAAPAGDAISVQCDAFEGLVEARVASEWGDYVVRLRRGPGYPLTAADAETLRRNASTPAARAAVAAVADGGEIWARLEDAEGHVLAASRGTLGPLSESAERAAEFRLPGRISARRVRLALDPGLDRR